MAKISINLLPPEFITQQLKKTKFIKVQIIGVTIVMVVMLLTSIIIALRILQSQAIVAEETRLKDDQTKVLGLKSTQASIFLLKNRISTINQYLGLPSKQSAMYQLIDKLIPKTASVSAVSVDKTGQTTMIATVPNYQTIDTLVDSFSGPNATMISQVSIDSLNRDKDGVYRISLKISPK